MIKVYSMSNKSKEIRDEPEPANLEAETEEENLKRTSLISYQSSRLGLCTVSDFIFR